MKITLSELRSVLEEKEEYVKLLSDYELLHSTLHHDLGLDNPAAFCNITQGLKKYGHSLPLNEIIFFYRETYKSLTVEEFMEKLNRLI
ncbi:MAG: hypothetical protein IKN67_03825 [Alphaproteobacteria bacterium]|nr:hypothetical protein [Alphaproteobacteria bacterium]